MFDRFNRFKDHFHNPNTHTDAPAHVEGKLFWGKSHRHVWPRVVCRWPLPIRREPFFTIYVPHPLGSEEQATGPLWQVLRHPLPPTHMLLGTAHRHFHLALWSSTRFGLLIFLIFLWRLLRSGVVRIGWLRGLEGHHILWDFYYFYSVPCSGNFCHWN